MTYRGKFSSLNATLSVIVGKNLSGLSGSQSRFIAESIDALDFAVKEIGMLLIIPMR